MGTNERKRQHRRKEYIILAAFFVLVGIGVVVLQSRMLEASRLRAHFESADGKKFDTLYLRIASTPAERTKGLMFEKDLDPNEGMVFVFPDEKQRSFWMKNTPLSLDMIFINAARGVNGVAEKTTPYSTQSYRVPAPSKYVVEVNAGQAKKFGAVKGNKLVFDGPLPKAVTDTVGDEKTGGPE